MNHFNYGIIIGAIESAPLLGAYLQILRVGVIHYNSHTIFEMLEFFTPWCQISELFISPALVRPMIQYVL